jgi:hypothetical protein
MWLVRGEMNCPHANFDGNANIPFVIINGRTATTTSHRMKHKVAHTSQEKSPTLGTL